MKQDLIKKYQNCLTSTLQTLETFTHSYESKTIHPDWGKIIDKTFYDEMCLSYRVQIRIYENIIKDLQTL